MSKTKQKGVNFLVCWVCGEDFSDIKDIHYVCKSSALDQSQSEEINGYF
jgi:hypothetical protein